jgi:5-methylcytosine-specific restriction endonuclease McrA
MSDRKATPKNCLNCECLFTGLKWFPSRGKFASTNGNRTCSRVCHLEWIRRNPERKAKISAAFTGHRHPNWQGGKARLNSISRRGTGWQKQRRAALARDRFQCADCGVSEAECRERYGRGLDVDHIEPFHNFRNSQEANRLRNLVSRCASCHRKAEAKRTGVQMALPFGDSEKRRHKGYARGERVNTAKVTALDVMAIRARCAAGMSRHKLAKEYGLALTTVSHMVARKIWRHVP